MSADMDWLTYRWVVPFCIFNKNRVSLYARACPLLRHFSCNHFISLFEQKILITISFLFCRGCFSTFLDQGGLMVMIVVQYPQHVYKTNLLSSSYPCFHTPHRCCCRKQPNQDDSEEVIVVEFQVLFRETKVLSNIHPCCHTPHRCCCRNQPN